MKFEVFQGKTQKGHKKNDNNWYWRLRAKNGRIVAIGGEPFKHQSNCYRACKALINGILNAFTDVNEYDFIPIVTLKFGKAK